jgi:acyl-CoA synthetase (NDP forming)
MFPEKDFIDRMDAIFSPESIAIIGLPRGMKMGKLFFLALLDQGFKGPIYPVNPKVDEIDGVRSYPDVLSIPGNVDLAIILVHYSQCLEAVRNCAQKGVKAAVIFTSGFSETGSAKGESMQEELTAVARSSGMRIFGPNCMGLYCPKTGLSFFPGMNKTHGNVAMISHSGSLANIIGRISENINVNFSKAVSLGNECDLKAADMLAYLGHDEDTEVIGAYLEGIRDGRRFLDSLKYAASRKPVIIWKVGLNEAGSRAAASHTAALTGTKQVWESVMRQTSAIPVTGLEQFLDTLVAASMLGSKLGPNIAALSGPGGLAVSAAEAIGAHGLNLAPLSEHTVKRLSEFVAETGSSLSNPIDVGLTASYEIDIYVEAARTVAADPNVDALVIVGVGLSEETNSRYTDGMIKAREESGKPFLMVNIPGLDERYARRFLSHNVPFFQSAERAIGAYSRLRESHGLRKSLLER